ncbi:hypothetical protein ACQPZZ_32565 [Microbispora sp. CA-135349]|uniref:hypothetical protein n=1 Tax=Microbispora sp. CA-135349 TaxID=3239953 RepID=UPI003D8DC8B8
MHRRSPAGRGLPQDFLRREIKSRLGTSADAVDLVVGFPHVTGVRASGGLLALSYDARIREEDARLCRDLDAAGANNRERARRMARWLAAEPIVRVDDPVATAALGRMRELVAAPSVTLGRVERYLRGCFRRLYRQRNIVLHGGSTRSIALPSTVRTAGSLVGAALDRLAHGHAVSGVAPLDMAGRAELALRVVEDADGWGPHELLDV